MARNLRSGKCKTALAALPARCSASEGTRPKLIFETEIGSPKFESMFDVAANLPEQVQKQYGGKPVAVAMSRGKYKVYVLPEKRRWKSYARLCEQYGESSVISANIPYDLGQLPEEIPSAGPV